MKMSKVPQLLAGDAIEILGRPPLLGHEDAERFDQLFLQFSVVIEPRDMIEWMLVKELAELSFEIERWGRLSIGLLERSRKDALADNLGSIDDQEGVPAGVRRRNGMKQAALFFEDEGGRRAIGDKLRKYSQNVDTVMATSFALNLPEIAAAARLKAEAEGRRNRCLRQIDKYRAGLGKKARLVIEAEAAEVKDAGKKEIAK
jgi:hypothetical protein